MSQDFYFFSPSERKYNIANKNKSRFNDMEPDLKIFRHLMIAA